MKKIIKHKWIIVMNVILLAIVIILFLFSLLSLFAFTITSMVCLGNFTLVYMANIEPKKPQDKDMGKTPIYKWLIIGYILLFNVAFILFACSVIPLKILIIICIACLANIAAIYYSHNPRKKSKVKTIN